MTAPGPLALSTGPYAGNAEHLRDELARIDLLVRAQVVRWRSTIGASKPERLWGMIHVSEAEIEQYLSADITSPDLLPDALAELLQPYWQAESDAAAVIRHAVESTPPSVDLRIQRLRARFTLTPAQVDVVLLALLPELDLRYGRIFGYLRDDASRCAPPIHLIGQMVHEKAPTLEEKSALFEPAGNLMRWRIVNVNSDDHSVRIDDRIASFLLGHDDSDRTLEHVVHSIPAGLTWDELFEGEPMKSALRAFAEHDTAVPSVVVLHGAAGSGRSAAARAISASRGLGLLSFEVERALRDPSRWDSLLTLAYREALLQNAALYFDGVEKLEAEGCPSALADSLTELAEEMPLLTFLATETTGEGSRHVRYPRFDFTMPHFELRRAIWVSHLPQTTAIGDRQAAAEKLAAAFQLSAAQIVEAIAAAEALARRRSVASPQITLDDLHEACRRQSGRRLLGFARRIEPKRGLTLDDVVLSRPNKAQLRELSDRVRLRSRFDSEIHVGRTITHGEGLLVLFAGPSGTGKTLAAEVIANQQGVDLYKVDVSTVVSKWVGDTEKNLGKVFADAEASDALLFFDECDSLFGQRGDISDGRDRWANLQTNYLLQRVEEYSGVVILASNLRKNIDDAFLRRIQVIVEFPPPDPEQRLEIWKRSIADADVREEDLRKVADRFSLTGGSIRNVSIEAGYRALAKDRMKLSLRDLIDAVTREYQKLGRPVTKGEFGEKFYDWALADVIAPTDAA